MTRPSSEPFNSSFGYFNFYKIFLLFNYTKLGFLPRIKANKIYFIIQELKFGFQNLYFRKYRFIWNIMQGIIWLL